MRIVSDDFNTLTATVCTVFEDLDLEEIMELVQVMTKVSSLTSKPFRRVNHSYQMKKDVYDMAYESVHYIIERVFRDPAEGLMVTLLEHTEGGENWTPETIEWTFPLDEVLHEIIGVPVTYTWGEG